MLTIQNNINVYKFAFADFRKGFNEPLSPKPPSDK